ncbi:hypothetical protein TorRG33x02_236570, partial [Trema orientale]
MLSWPIISHFLKRKLLALFFRWEPQKALGLDGFNALIFQKHWDIVGDFVSIACLNILNGKNSIKSLNHTHIVLILKIKNPKEVSDYRPISLCNVIYKIITKTIANRMKM